MPFDGTNYDTPTLRRARLVEALRTDMPEGFGWDFRSSHHKAYPCGSAGCALGLAFEMGLISVPSRFGAFELGLDLNQSEIFSASEEATLRHYRAEPSEVTPAMVADALERIA